MVNIHDDNTLYHRPADNVRTVRHLLDLILIQMENEMYFYDYHTIEFIRSVQFLSEFIALGSKTVLKNSFWI